LEPGPGGIPTKVPSLAPVYDAEQLEAERSRPKPALRLLVCFADGIELNREMVRQGWALAWYR
jgi:hypothetical protein